MLTPPPLFPPKRTKKKMETEERIRKEFEQRGIKLASVDESEVMDSNVSIRTSRNV